MLELGSGAVIGLRKTLKRGPRFYLIDQKNVS